MKHAADWERVQELFLTSSELPEAGRKAFLDLHCGIDGDLRRDVEALLTAHEGADERLRAIVTAAAFEMQAAEAAGAVGRRIGPYTIARETGSGGMGTVYLAFRDDDQFRQRVAIKVINRGMDSEFALTRFRRERQVLADLQHVHIARLLDGGATSDGLPFFAMEYLEGETLDVFCRRTKPDLRARLDLFLHICGAVQYAHRNLVIHGDLKPGNILVGADGVPKLLDFGIATLIDVHSDPMAGASPISGRYASPEQRLGRTVNTTSDVYSLGAILDELTAEKPRGDLEYIVRMAMRDEPEARYLSADELALDIHRYLELRPVLARQGSAWYRAARLVRRRWFPLLAAAAVLASLVGGIVAERVKEREAEAAREVAAERLTQMVTLANRSLSDVSLLMERMPGAIPARKELTGATVDFLEKLAREAGPDVRLRLALAKAYSQLGMLQGGPDSANMGDVEGAMKSYREGSALLEGHSAMWQQPAGRQTDEERLAVWVELERKLGMLATARVNPVAVARMLHVLAATDGHPGGPAAGVAANPDLARSRAGLYLALARGTQNDMPTSIGYAGQNLSALETLVRQYPEDADLRYDLSVAHNQLGYLLWNRSTGDPEAAAEHYKECLRLREQLVRERPLDTVYRRSLILLYQHFGSLQGGALVANMGKPEVARLYYRKALDLVEAGPAEWQNALWVSDYAELLIRFATLDVPPAGVAASLEMLRRALGMVDSLTAGGDADLRYSLLTVAAHEYMGRRLTTMGRYGEAISQHERAASIAAAVLAGHPGDSVSVQQTYDAECGIVRAMALSGDQTGALARARALVQQARQVEIAEDREAMRAKLMAQAGLSLVRTYLTFGQFEEAKDAAQEAAGRVRPLLTGARWDPNMATVRAAQTLIAESSKRMPAR